MGKPEEHQLEIAPVAVAGGGGNVLLRHCGMALAGVSRAFSLRCVVVLVLSACVLLSALFWLPPFRSFGSGFVPHDDGLAAEIQASFILQKPMSFLAAHVGRLEYDIFEEIGVPNTKASIISMHSLTPANSTYVVFGVFPDSKFAMISSPVLSVLRSSLIELALQQLNFSLTASIFGHASSFEILRFPGGITVIPPQSASIWEITQILFNFTLNNSIFQIEKYLDELKGQLKFGLNLRSYENVYVHLTNINGSTVAPPVIVQASVLSDVGSHSLLPNRLKQLAQVIKDANNLGLDHSVFGKVKQVELSSYLKHSLECPSPSPSPSPSPLPLSSPSPSPAVELPYASPPVTYPILSPSYPPSTDHRHQSPCLYCSASPPSGSPLPSAPARQNRPQPPAPKSQYSPGPSVSKSAPSPLYAPSISPSLPPNSHATYDTYPPSSSHCSYSAISPQHGRPEDRGRTPRLAPDFSPLSPAVIYGSSPSPESSDKESSKDSPSPSYASSQISPSPLLNVAPYPYAEIWQLWLMGFTAFVLLFGPCKVA